MIKRVTIEGRNVYLTSSDGKTWVSDAKDVKAFESRREAAYRSARWWVLTYFSAPEDWQDARAL